MDAATFTNAFETLDKGHNFVSLVTLRKAFPSVSREAFDSTLRQLRIDGLFSVVGAESVHGISQEEREAGLQEGGLTLLYVMAR